MRGFVLEEATIAQVHKSMKKGILKCRELVEGYLERIEAYDKKGPSINSVIYVNPKALEEADKLDEKFNKQGFTGPLHGIPVLLKDNINTFDMPTTAGSLSLEGVVPERDAFITRRLREAGALILAKVNLHEFAIWGETISSILGQTLNPYDLTRTPGGSSGGTGASVAANFGMLGIGTDTINSIRSPASANNLVGIRPTMGLISRNGIVPYSYTQDTAGPITRTVEDAVRLLDVIAGYDNDDSETSWSFGRKPKAYIEYLKLDGLEGKRIGILESFFGKEEIHEDTNKAVRNSIKTMEEKGAIIVSIDEIIDSEYLVKNVSVHLHDLKDHLNSYLDKLPENVPVRTVKQIFDSGKYHRGIKDNLKKAMNLNINTPEYNKRLVEREKIRKIVMKLMADYELDGIVYPHQKQLVCLIGESQNERNGVLGSVLGFPSICVQAGFSKASDTAPIGIPIGMEILGRPFSEGKLIEIAYSFEQTTKIRKMPLSTPPLRK
ncbi:amidase family protein [Maledivibacter halophilus]|uniref:Asp-tRNAAsn/Glu-tRNAGln amidotransferase A subunit n=1 Tax=Maledivibacter halophilus TaxID=36842 RepID=A0A1T5IT79_9FIRM|nr:amidase family protein [Maledivibacter halophilus]SKC42394.1 Asp-tRNAAsn/Glu-tRNAGln amidotransferase A subunit [Maledivibacter halophilus]